MNTVNVYVYRMFFTLGFVLVNISRPSLNLDFVRLSHPKNVPKLHNLSDV